MKIAELIDALNEMRDEHGDDVEVRLMQQPSWPFEYSIDGVTDTEAMNDYEEPDEIDDDEMPIVYITEGQQLAYGRKAAWS